MGRKSSAKSQTRPSSGSGSGGPEDGRRSTTALLTVAIIVIAAIVGVYVATRSTQTEPVATQTAAPPPAPDTPPPMAKFGPHKQDRLPPLPYDPAPARPPDVVRAAYTFAAEHPEILGYVPCYCGCERSGHRGNDDCFIAGRDATGDVTEWEPHGMT
jgi:Protein of unknown function with PCYCGC motif